MASIHDPTWSINVLQLRENILILAQRGYVLTGAKVAHWIALWYLQPMDEAALRPKELAKSYYT